jgi:hypothetical protein
MQLLKAFKRKFGIAAPRVAVRTHMPWYLRWLGIVAVGGLVYGAGLAVYDFGMEFAGFRRGEADRALEKLTDTIESQQRELSELRAKVAQAERQLQIEHATYSDMEKQVKSLSGENATLKEDLAFFQSLMPVGGRDGALTINRFRLEPETLPGEYRYRLLLVQTGLRVNEYRGRLEFVLSVQQGGRKLVLTLPSQQDKNVKEYQLSFKFFQRIEGTFRIPPDAVVKSMQVRVFENGGNAPKLTQTLNVS